MPPHGAMRRLAAFKPKAELFRFRIKSEIRRKAADSASARQGEATTYCFEMKAELRYAVGLEPSHGALEAIFCRILAVAGAVVGVKRVGGVGVHHKL